ncbi:MAG: lipid II:glycine glycyltransferase FemX [Candidatus Cryptobacteroides sp.]
MECPDKEVTVKLLIAWYEEIPLAAMFLVMSSHRATYLYGASSSEYRNVMPAYALQWKAMRIAKAHKCREYDMFGIAPQCDPSHPMYGLYKFKSGFGGDIFHQLGCWDYPVDDAKYNYYSACELSSQGYYQNGFPR